MFLLEVEDINEKWQTLFEYKVLKRVGYELRKTITAPSTKPFPVFSVNIKSSATEDIEIFRTQLDEWFSTEINVKELSLPQIKEIAVKASCSRSVTPRVGLQVPKRSLTDFCDSVTLRPSRKRAATLSGSLNSVFLESMGDRLANGFVPVLPAPNTPAPHNIRICRLGSEEESSGLKSVKLSTSMGTSDTSFESSESSESEEDLKNQIITDTALMEESIKVIQSPNSSDYIVGTILRFILQHTRASHLFLIRLDSDGNLVLDASMTCDRTWTLLEHIPLYKTDLFPLSVLTESRKTIYPIQVNSNDEFNIKYNSDNEYQRPIESILCIPIVLQSKYLGSLYLTHYRETNRFIDVSTTTITLISTNILSMLNNLFLKKTQFKRKIQEKLLPATKPISHTILQDSLLYYNSSENSWQPGFLVLGDHKLLLFSSPYDTHPRETILLETITDIQVTARTKANKKFTKISVPICGKKMSHCALFYVCREESVLWIATESLDVAHNWYSNLQDCLKIMKCPDDQHHKIPADIRINASEVLLGEIIGQGAAASVYVGTWNQTQVAVKQLIDQFDEHEVEAFFKEMNILRTMRHPNIVTMFGGYVSEQGKSCIVFEFAARGCLSTVIQDPLCTLTNELRQQLILQTAQALSYLHSFDPPVIHRDLKPANILVKEDWTVKLADFGLARKTANSMTRYQGTAKWMAPEILSNARYSTKADIYSFSLIVWEVMVRERFFEDFQFSSQLEIQVVNHNVRPSLDSIKSENLKKMINSCWAADPEERPDAYEVVQFLSSLNLSEFEV